MLKDASSAPATVPVASKGSDADGDQANVDVRCISFNFMRVADEQDVSKNMHAYTGDTSVHFGSVCPQSMASNKRKQGGN